MAGLRDSNIQQKILSLAAMKTILKLEELVTYVAAEESGYKELANIGQNANVMVCSQVHLSKGEGLCTQDHLFKLWGS